MEGYANIADLRSAEMKCAAQVLGLADVIYLGYRDSGMPGSPDNNHPNSLANAHVDEVSRKLVKIIRDLKPEVVITGDAGGAYGHPDHIAIHHATVKAFYAANDPAQFPEEGPPFQPAKLYFGIRPLGFMKVIIRLMPLFGQNPRRFGRNKDLDLTKMIGEKYPVNAVIRLSNQAMKIRNKAAACHASQGGGRPRPGPFRIFELLEKIRGPRDYFMRGYPKTRQEREKDLFQGVS
jgi:LmbE family N-acetylglucosaminyl deacetylase